MFVWRGKGRDYSIGGVLLVPKDVVHRVGEGLLIIDGVNAQGL